MSGWIFLTSYEFYPACWRVLTFLINAAKISVSYKQPIVSLYKLLYIKSGKRGKTWLYSCAGYDRDSFNMVGDWLVVWFRCSSLNLKDSVPGAPQTALQNGTSKSESDHLIGSFQLEVGGSVGVRVSQHGSSLVWASTHSPFPLRVFLPFILSFFALLMVFEKATWMWSWP